MTTARNRPTGPVDLPALRMHAHTLRRTMLQMARGKGDGYIAQGLGSADFLAALYFHELTYDASEPRWPGRDRFLMSTGHYSIALYAVLAEAGYLDHAELPTYGLNGSRLPMSTFDDLEGVEIVGGSLGQGLGQAVGMAIGLRLDRSPARVFCEISDGELEEGSTWEAFMSGATFNCDNLVTLVDCNGIQADGPVTVRLDPVLDKIVAFGWDAVEVNGNDMAQLSAALEGARKSDGRPKAIVMRTTPGWGVPTLVARERAHFVRVDEQEWDRLLDELDANADHLTEARNA
jgi:transketolase